MTTNGQEEQKEPTVEIICKPVDTEPTKVMGPEGIFLR